MNYYQTSAFTPAVKHLLIINGLTFLALNTPALQNLLFFNFALFPIESGMFRPWQLITYMFLHGGMFHIFFNMFALWIFGTAIESVWGTKTFALYYFAAGVGAAIIHMITTGSPVIGASGGVFAILLAFGLMFPNRRIYMLLIPVGIPAKYFVIIYGVFELMMGISNLQTGIAHFAHLGGMIVGFVLIRIWKLPTDLE
ncbi:MAG: rhomboid family intramembrane serine protease [Candidatus Cyclonatronum sp.]|uniref:rhomboid family intramembrane serine protease n=1 Tax=Cyclonatronum sp. TaxID=3024185 RepID=UPI0025C663D5|nr:rhomboid family intramembrane serine protease [Cyclonatronum sp.]MCC5932809.1 rhomboid family intramembrane serine protease [Balneolales bacterium]MCH8485599.1 rhomboid family intramembrane serine protease [Cyclonatronum sp.]